MKATQIAVASVILALGLGLVIQQSGAVGEQEKGAKAFNLVLKSVKVKETNKDGEAWDINNGRPDIVVRIRNLTNESLKEFATEEKTDMFEATSNRTAMLVIDGQRVQIEVFDKDVANDDLIGRTTTEINKDMLKKGNTQLSFDQVHSVMLEFTTPNTK